MTENKEELLAKSENASRMFTGGSAEPKVAKGTDLYHRMLAFDHGDKERDDLMAKVWSPTPWMVDAWTGSWDNGRQREMIWWCHEQFGEQCSPIHEREGRWQRGGVTIHGWTWFGFSTEDEMRQFIERWPPPDPAGAGVPYVLA